MAGTFTKENAREIGKLGGRPKGQKNKIPVAAKALAMQRLEQMLGRAYQVINDELLDGNAQVAMWMIDKVAPKGTVSLPKNIDIKLDTVDNVIEATQEVVEMVLQRSLTVDQGMEVLKMLSQYIAFRAWGRLGDLQDAVDKLEQLQSNTIDGQATKYQPGTVPAWGVLTAGSKTANDTPAE